MSSNNKRRKLEEEEGGRRGRGNKNLDNKEVPSASSKKVKKKGEEGNKMKDESVLDQDKLEKAVMDHYRKLYKKEGGADGGVVSMIIYRVNLWKNKLELLQPTCLQITTSSSSVEQDCEMEADPGSFLERLGGRGDIGVVIDVGKDEPNTYRFRRLPNYDQAAIVLRKDGNSWLEMDPRLIQDPLDCKIIGPKYLDDFIWIESLEDATFVNGKRIPKGKKQMLVDGDIIGVGSPHHDLVHQWGHHHSRRDFVFRVKCLNKDEDQGNIEDSASPRFQALHNSEILKEIFSFLSFKELETARVVNKSWKQVADPILFSRSIVHLSNDRGDFPFTVSVIKEYKIPNWRIYKEKVPKLLKDSCHLVRYLDFQRGVVIKYGTGDWKDVRKVLLHTPNLDELRIRIEDGMESDEEEEDEDSRNHKSTVGNETLLCPTFPSVKYLNLALDASGDFREDIAGFLLQASTLFPNVQRISSNPGIVSFGRKMAKCIANNNLWSNTLKGFSCEMGRGSGGSGSNSKMFNMAKAVTQFTQNLTRLTLHHIRIQISKNAEPEVIRSFENMLGRHAETLEHLELSFCSRIFSTLEQNQGLRFPAFPKLKTLEFLVGHPLPHCSIIFPSGKISYEKDLPEIQTLRIADFGYYFQNENMLPYFIPEDSETVSRTMRWVEFFVERKKMKGVEEPGWCWYKSFARRFRRMFPNVHHPLVENVDFSWVEEMEESESSEDDSESSSEDSESSVEDSESSEMHENEESRMMGPGPYYQSISEFKRKKPELKSLEFGEKRKRGRPKKATSALPVD